MTFKNETFVMGMEDNTSTVYQQFMERYSALVCILTAICVSLSIEKNIIIGTLKIIIVFVLKLEKLGFAMQ